MPSTPKPYLIDANTFMEASRGYYSFDFAKPFWKKLPEYAHSGQIVSLDKVFDEIDKGSDELKKWANSHFKSHFADSQTSRIVGLYGELVIWADKHAQYNQKAKDKFMEDQNADAWLIAYAKANNCILVTDERSDPASVKRIMIPDVCSQFHVDCCDVFTMLRALNFSFSS
jgi:hypothetical protein